MLVVTRLDRLGRSLRELIDLVGELEGRGVGFRSLKESLDTTNSRGAADLPRLRGSGGARTGDHPREDGGRTKVGTGPGRHGGRPRALDEGKAKLARRRLKDEGEHSVEEICSILGVGRSTLCRYLGEGDQGEAAKS